MRHAFPGFDPDTLTVGEYFDFLKVAHRITAKAYGEGYNDERALRGLTNQAKVEAAVQDIPI